MSIHLNIVIEFKQGNSQQFQIFGYCKVFSFRQVNDEKLLTLLHCNIPFLVSWFHKNSNKKG